MDTPPPPLISRRDFLRTGGVATISTLAGSSAPAAWSETGEFDFVVANDLHYRDARCGVWLERVVASIGRLRPAPAFVMLAGDLSDEGTREQLGGVREIFRPLQMPVRAVIGNH